MILSKNTISNLIDKKEFSKLKLYISLGYDLSLTDVNHDFVSKFGNATHSAFEAIIANDIYNLKKIKSHRLNVKNNNGYSLLHWAIITHNHAATYYLIEAGIDIESVTNTHDTAISIACRFNNTKAFVYLLRKYPQKNKRYLALQNQIGFTPLHFACANKNIQMITIILNICSSSLIVERNIYDATSLHWLVHGRNISDQFKLKLLNNYYEAIYRNHSNKLINDMLEVKNALGLTPIDWLDMYTHSKSQQFLTRK